MIFNPVFDSIMTQIKSMPESEWETPKGKKLWRLAAKYTPPELNKLFIKGAQEKGLFPKPTRCDENGNPVYCLEEVAAFFGKTPEEGRQAFEEMIADDPDALDGIYRGATYPIN